MEPVGGKELVVAISSLIEGIASVGDSQSLRLPPTVFSCSCVPRIRLCNYIERIYSNSMCSDSCLILAIIYMDRLVESTQLCIVSQNMHKLLLTAIMLASKFFDDTFCSNAFFAEVGLVTLSELNRMEQVFLSAIHYSLYVDDKLFLKYYSSIYYRTHSSPRYADWTPYPMYPMSYSVSEPAYPSLINPAYPSVTECVYPSVTEPLYGWSGAQSLPYADYPFIAVPPRSVSSEVELAEPFESMESAEPGVSMMPAMSITPMHSMASQKPITSAVPAMPVSSVTPMKPMETMETMKPMTSTKHAMLRSFDSVEAREPPSVLPTFDTTYWDGHYPRYQNRWSCVSSKQPNH